MEFLSFAFAMALFFAFLTFIAAVLKVALWMTIIYAAWKIFEIFVLDR